MPCAGRRDDFAGGVSALPLFLGQHLRPGVVCGVREDHLGLRVYRGDGDSARCAWGFWAEGETYIILQASSKAEARVAGVDFGAIAVAEVAEEVRFPACVLEEEFVDFGLRLKPDMGPASRPTARAAMRKYAAWRELLRKAVSSARALLEANMERKSAWGERVGSKS